MSKTSDVDMRRPDGPVRKRYAQGRDPLRLLLAIRVFLVRIRELHDDGVPAHEILAAVEKMVNIRRFPGRDGSGDFQRRKLHEELDALDLGPTPRRG